MAKYLVEPVIGAGGVVTTTPQLATVVASGTQYWDDVLKTAFTSDGSAWVQAPVRLLLQTGIPFVMPASGTVSAAGALSGMGVAVNAIYANAYFFFPANALSASSAAGWYFTQMSSTTAGTVFLNTYVSGVPSIPATSALIPVTAGQGAYTQLATTVSCFQFTLPANYMGPNGRLRFSLMQSNNNSAGNKFSVIQFGGNSIVSLGPTTNITNWYCREICNQGVTNAQNTGPSNMVGPAASASIAQYFAVDTTAAVTILTQTRLSVPATDTMTVESFAMELLPQ